MKNSTLLAIVLILIVVRLIFAWLEFKYEHRKNLIRVSRNIFILVYFFIVLIMFLIKNPSIITINSIVNCIVILLGIFIPIYYIFDTARILRRVINKKRENTF